MITHDGLLIMASETGVLHVKPEDVKFKGRLQPGRMLLCDTSEGRIIPDEEIKQRLSSRRPFGEWIRENQIVLDKLSDPPRVYGFDPESILIGKVLMLYTNFGEVPVQCMHAGATIQAVPIKEMARPPMGLSTG